MMKQIKVKPVKNISKETAQFYGDLFGVSAVIELKESQIWKAYKKQNYWYIQGRGEFCLRLTDAAFNRLFTVIS